MRLTIDKLTASEGVVLGHTRWLKSDQRRINGFAEITEDRQWIHTDSERARSGPYGTTIAHGYLTLSLVSTFLFELLEVDGAASIVNYGLDKVRFPSAVPVGSKLRGHGELIAAQDLGAAVQTTTRIAVTDDGNDKPAMVADVLTRFQR